MSNPHWRPPTPTLHLTLEIRSVDVGLIQLTYAIDREIGQSVNKEYFMSEYSDIFKGVGIFPGKCKLYLHEDAILVIAPPRRVPEALKSRLKAELDQMVKHQIISPVTEPTDWVHPFVVDEKPNGKLRIISNFTIWSFR